MRIVYWRQVAQDRDGWRRVTLAGEGGGAYSPQIAEPQKKKENNLIGLMGRDSTVGVAIRYGLDGPGIESRCG